MKKLRISNSRLGKIRFRRFGDKYLLTNDWGRFVFVSDEDFQALLSDKLTSSTDLSEELTKKGFLLNRNAKTQWADVYQSRKEHLFKGPLLHIFVVTLRCDHQCIYCQAGRRPMNSFSYDMSPQTAAASLDIAFSSPSPFLTIEFQGGEPLANFDIVRKVIDDGRKREKKEGKTVYFTLVSNLSLMDDEKLKFLIDNRVQICTSLDGPKKVHDRNRPKANFSSYNLTTHWMKKINNAYVKEGLDPDLAHVGALLTVTKDSLQRGPEIVDEYVRQGLKVIHLRPLQPFGFAEKTWKKQSYSAKEFLDFYEKTFDYILDLNKKGVEILEKTASLFLSGILTDKGSDYMDLRSPCGAGIGQIAYNHDGRVYTCDEGRMVGTMGDDIFCIGNVGKSNYQDIIRHPGVRSVCVASCLESLPECTDCAYLPYCGVCPVFSYVTQGDLFPHSPSCERCAIQKGILDIIFNRLLTGGEAIRALLKRWTIKRDCSSVYTPRP